LYKDKNTLGQGLINKIILLFILVVVFIVLGGIFGVWRRGGGFEPTKGRLDLFFLNNMDIKKVLEKKWPYHFYIYIIPVKRREREKERWAKN
jgi:hypothetical protein